MQLPVKAHYAVIAILAIAREHDSGSLVAARMIANEHAVPSQFLVQILQQLRAANLISSTRGSNGGFRLSRSPNGITLADVIDAVCPASIASSTFDGNSNIQHAVQQLWDELAAQERSLYQSWTVADMLERAQVIPSNMFYI